MIWWIFLLWGASASSKEAWVTPTRTVPIRFGPGRHITSGAIFLYYEGPDGMIYEYSTGVRSCDESWRPRQFPFTAEAFCGWGAKPQIPEFSA